MTNEEVMIQILTEINDNNLLIIEKCGEILEKITLDGRTIVIVTITIMFLMLWLSIKGWDKWR